LEQNIIDMQNYAVELLRWQANDNARLAELEAQRKYDEQRASVDRALKQLYEAKGYRGYMQRSGGGSP
jgi:hypothetical protein